MKAIKIHRGERMFHRRSLLPKLIGGLLAAAVLIAGGYLGACLIADQLQHQPAVSSSDPAEASTEGTENEDVSGNTDPTSDVESDPVSKPPAVDTDAPVMAVIDTGLLRDTAALGEALTAAKNAGCDTVVVELKDSNGELAYTFTGERAVLSKAIQDDALTSSQLTEALNQIRATGLRVAVKLFAFMDRTAPYGLSSARIRYDGEAGTVWLDGALDKGGRPWLNPYADEAHAYLTDLIAEVAAMDGVDYVMLDGVQFPASIAYADFGSENTALSRAEVLTLFVSRAKQAAGTVPVILCADNAAVLGNDTKVYGDNPLTFGADMVAVDLRPETLGNRLTLGAEVIEQPNADPAQTLQQVLNFIGLRMQVMDTPRPLILARIGSTDTAAAVREAGAGLVIGD